MISGRVFVVPRLAWVGALSLVIGVASATEAERIQGTSEGIDEIGATITVDLRDREAARNLLGRGIHTSGTGRAEGGRKLPKTFKLDQAGGLIEVSSKGHSFSGAQGPQGAAAAAVPDFTGPGFYPDDLVQNVPPGPVITDAQIHNVFINCDVTCFQRPGVFLRLFFASNFVHVLDQYTGTTQSGRYVVGGAAFPQYSIQGNVLNDGTDVAAIVHAAASTYGTGYGHIYNVFVPSGIDVCISTTTGPQCFSPNNPANWFFCAYHGFVDFSDIGHVLYTVIPYPDQALIDTNGNPNYVCDVGQTTAHSNTTPTPNDVVVDSIASFLDHELSETVTDPDLNAFQVQNSLADYLSEIGDICVNPAYLYTPFAVSGRLYYIQPEYSDTYHACVTVP